MMRLRRLPISLAFGLLVTAGCTVVGPSAIRGGRLAYNDAIIATNGQQVLMTIVRMRYGEPTGLLAVSSVTANMSIRGTVGAQFGIGPDSNFEGSLVPLSAGVAYEENPTISYTPVQGEKFLRQLLAPMPLDLTLLVMGATRSPRSTTLLIRSINRIQNPGFLSDPSVTVDDRFRRVADILAALDRAGHLAWAQESGETAAFAMVLQGTGPTYAELVGELHALLDLGPADPDAVITVPIYLGVGKRDGPSIEVRTRSVFDLLNIAAASVEVPPEQVESGLALPYPAVGPAGSGMRIRRSKDRPEQAMTAVRHHGWWYSIDGTDAQSKETFRIIEALLTVRMADTIDRSAAPVLTVPVSQ